jgi:hypothetical protein
MVSPSVIMPHSMSDIVAPDLVLCVGDLAMLSSPVAAFAAASSALHVDLSHAPPDQLFRCGRGLSAGVSSCRGASVIALERM